MFRKSKYGILPLTLYGTIILGKVGGYSRTDVDEQEMCGDVLTNNISDPKTLLQCSVSEPLVLRRFRSRSQFVWSVGAESPVDFFRKAKKNGLTGYSCNMQT